MGPIWAGLICSGALALLMGRALGIASVGLSQAASTDSMVAQDGSAERGRALFSLHCSPCHRLDGVPLAIGMVGPNLTDFKSQGVIAGAVPNTPENLARFLANPASVKRDALMPPLGLTAAQINELVAFLLPPQAPGEEPRGAPTLPESPTAGPDE